MILHQNLAVHFGSKSMALPSSCDKETVDDYDHLFADTSDIEEDLGSRWVPPTSVNEDDDYHFSVLKKDGYLVSLRQ